MGFWKRIKNLWVLSSWSPEDGIQALSEKITTGHSGQKVEFIMPNKVNEIIKMNPQASIDDVLN